MGGRGVAPAPHPHHPARCKCAWDLHKPVASAMHKKPATAGGRGEIAMVEAIQDQWVILAALAVLVAVVAWLFLRR